MGTELTSSFGNFAGLQFSTQGHVSSLEEKQKDETFAGNGDAAGVAVVSAAPPDLAEEGGKDEVPEKDDDPSAVAALPPLSSDSSDSTQESGQEAASLNYLKQAFLQDNSVTLFLLSWPGVLEDQELQVRNAIAAAANPPKESNSISSNDNGSSSETPPDPAEIPVPVPSPEIEPPSSANEISATSSEVKAPPFQMTPPIPEVKQTGK